MRRSLRERLLVASLLVAASACTSYGSVVSTVAHAEVDGVAALRPVANLAGSICRREAVYTYYQYRLGLSPVAPIPPAAFASWYVHTRASLRRDGTPLSWSEYCRENDLTGDVFHLTLLSLREYATALEAMADAKDFDGSGLTSAGTGAGALAATLSGSTTISTTAQGIGSGAAGFSTVFVSQLRTVELKESIKRSATDMSKLLGDLAAYVDALYAELTLAARQRDTVLAAFAAHRDPKEQLLASLDPQMAIDLAPEGGERLARQQRQLDVDKSVLVAMATAHNKLADAAGLTSNAAAAKEAAEALKKLVATLEDERPEER